MCGPCVRSSRIEDCEYTDAQGRSRTQLLEENIARLESRIRELENPEENISTVTLHDPYQSPQGSPSSLVLTVPNERSPSSASGNGENIPIYRGSILSNMVFPGSAESPSGSYPHNFVSPNGSPLSAFENSGGWWNSEEPPPHIALQLSVLLSPSDASASDYICDTPELTPSSQTRVSLGSS